MSYLTIPLKAGTVYLKFAHKSVADRIQHSICGRFIYLGAGGKIEITFMCRNIKTLFNFEPPVTDEEIRAASLQFVRKLSGFNKPSKANEVAFLTAVDEVAAVSRKLLNALETNSPPRNREEEAAKARARSARRFPSGEVE